MQMWLGLLPYVDLLPNLLLPFIDPIFRLRVVLLFTLLLVYVVLLVEEEHARIGDRVTPTPAPIPVMLKPRLLESAEGRCEREVPLLWTQRAWVRRVGRSR